METAVAKRKSNKKHGGDTKGSTTFMLIGGKENPIWMLRHKDVYGIDKNGDERQLKYVRGAKTIWADELEGRRRTMVEFTDGSLVVKNNNQTLINYLKAHPEFGKKFEIYDPAQKAKEKLEKLDRVDEAKEILRKMNSDEKTAIATLIWGDRQVSSLTDVELSLKLREYVEDYESYETDDLTKTEYFLAKYDSPFTHAKFLVIQAIKAKVLEKSVDSTSVKWGKNGEVIVPVAVGKDPVSVMAEFLLSDQGTTTFQELKKQMG